MVVGRSLVLGVAPGCLALVLGGTLEVLSRIDPLWRTEEDQIDQLWRTEEDQIDLLWRTEEDEIDQLWRTEEDQIDQL